MQRESTRERERERERDSFIRTYEADLRYEYRFRSSSCFSLASASDCRLSCSGDGTEEEEEEEEDVDSGEQWKMVLKSVASGTAGTAGVGCVLSDTRKAEASKPPYESSPNDGVKSKASWSIARDRKSVV